MASEIFYAHSAPRREDWEPLRVHLERVGERAAAHAAAFGAADEARFAGLLHDLGKYGEVFTRRLEGLESGLDHWSAGAWAALLRAGQRGMAAALAVEGHHIGLQRGARADFRALEPTVRAANHPLGLRLTETDVETLIRRFEGDGLELPSAFDSCFDPGGRPLARMLSTRLLFSALVDADFVETEAHFQAVETGRSEPVYRAAGPELNAERAEARLLDHVEALSEASDAAPVLRRLRADLLTACLEGARREPGVFTLSAPTGGGKTLAMLAFALRHARLHGLRRIVFAVPYVSILEQTARVYEALLAPLFGSAYVLEHHGLADTGAQPAPRGEPDGAGERGLSPRLAAENWDAPLILTTNVQLLESLFSNRPSACRKLHRLARSVVLFDEAQTLPLKLALPTLGALARLSEDHGASVVFATATQPAFDHLDRAVRKVAGIGWSPRELAAGRELFGRIRRTRVEWEVEERLEWLQLADRVARWPQALCILNLKRQARELAAMLEARQLEGLLHLSTNLCPAHRERVLAEVRRRLEIGAPCRLVATQCVEAGVDLDFPLVLRAFGPLDALVQAAGRCNRAGKMSAPGEVRIFLPPEHEGGDYPPGGYAQAAQVTWTLLAERGADGMDLDDPELFRAYCRRLYDVAGTVGGESDDLERAIEAMDFAETARLYRLIDHDTIEVLVPFIPARHAELREELYREGRLTSGWIRRARAHAVSLYRPHPQDDVWTFLEPAPGPAGTESRDWWVHLDENAYDPLLGVGKASSLWIG